MIVTKSMMLCCGLIVIELLRPFEATDSNDLQQDISIQIEKNNGAFLSRKRRYLMFPEGSSFQLVFCLTYPSIGVGSYFVFGHTAALAWELPSMRLFYDQRDFEKKEDEPAETTTTEISHDIDYSQLNHERIGNDPSSWDPYDNLADGDFANLNFNGHLKNSYNNPFLNFYRSNENTFLRELSSNEGGDSYWQRNDAHVRSYNKNENFQRYNNENSHMMSDMDPKYYSIHKRTRRDLYQKIERFLNTLNLDGKACILKAICEIRKSTHQKESLMEEVFKTVFRVNPHESHEDNDEYDAAANPEHNCDEMYRTCQGSIRNFKLLVRK